MPFLPYFQETIVLPDSGQQVLDKIKQATRPLEKGVEYPYEIEKKFLFNGWVKENRFRISRRSHHPEIFLPLIEGNIEITSTGSILFLRYRLFFGAVIFLVFWTIIAVLLSLFFLIVHHNHMYSAVSIGLGVLNFIIATKNFHLQIKSSRSKLFELLES